ncbi:MAG: acyltransferase [Sediminibacterium sp.]|nr:acyltransferase [Sediminibacterium sp.]TXT32952.1 MAG: exopolysaccharide biosynthesis acetyltransferase [Chitinophagaceae bacterium]
MLSIFNRVFFGIYLRYQAWTANLNLAYYKYRWAKEITFGDSFKFGKYSTIQILSGLVNVVFGTNVFFREYCSIICSDKAELNIGDNVFFNNYCSINCLGKILIGKNTIFGEGVRLYDHNHGYEIPDILYKDQPMKIGQIIIGDNCWIGSNTIILPNVVIGDNVIIGAGNIIFKSIPANTLVISKRETIQKELL